MQDNKASRIFLVAAIVLGVLATVLSFAFLDGGSGGAKLPKASVVVAATDLRANVAIDPARDFKVVEVPITPELRPMLSLVIDANKINAYKGMKLNRRVQAGTYVTDLDFSFAADFDLKGDSRAITIPVKGANALGGLLVPGDYVKLLVTKMNVGGAASAPPPSNDTSGGASAAGGGDMGGGTFAGGRMVAWQTSMISNGQPYRVLAVGRSLTRTRSSVTASDRYEGGFESDNQATVTLEVTEAQAREILQSTGAGTLPVTLLLCPPPTTRPTN